MEAKNKGLDGICSEQEYAEAFRKREKEYIEENLKRIEKRDESAERLVNAIRFVGAATTAIYTHLSIHDYCSTHPIASTALLMASAFVGYKLSPYAAVGGLIFCNEASELASNAIDGISAKISNAIKPVKNFINKRKNKAKDKIIQEENEEIVKGLDTVSIMPLYTKEIRSYKG